MMFPLRLTFLFVLLLLPRGANAQEAATAKFWQEILPGFEFALYEIPTNQSVLKSEVFLLKFSLKDFTVLAATAQDVSSKRTTVDILAKKFRGVAAINANFFDPNDNPLGLVVKNGLTTNRLQNGGNLLTGVFYLTHDNKASIVHRDSLPEKKPKVAFQSGPRLLASSNRLPLKEPDNPTRRSGVATTANGEIILFATRLRYPGASFAQLQDMLLDPRINAVDALNFDGGGSSQLYIKAQPPHFGEDVFISGGDIVPVALIVKKK